MCHPVEIPFQVPDLLANKAIKEAHNTINNMTETPTEILGQNALNNGQRIRFSNDLMKVQFLCKKDSSLNC